jgi:nitroreductase
MVPAGQWLRREDKAVSDDPKLFDIMFSTRAMRRLKPDPVPRALIEQILRAGQAAPNGGNTQRWGFIVVEDPAIKKQVQAYYQRAYDEFVAGYYGQHRDSLPEGEPREKLERQQAAVIHLTHHFHEAPVWIVACVRLGAGKAEIGSGGSIYPAVQNMLLAARALGLGSVLTTRHLLFREEVDTIFGLPENVSAFAILPIGYPEGRFGPVGRLPLEDFVHHDRWGRKYFP